ncbi:hypothetical protein DPMN_031605 [Dreissena polymorpha]|uniref:Uncharacterized protein n=1 Tax=Dreissena polymorpha TaxID=45954 RepID=A0A9D4RJ94_DREPO|nr:hypothetical protein DPMN_031605 [Dreissena polymorpha]
MTPTPGGKNVLTKCHEDWAKNMSSRLFTCFYYIHIEKTAPSPGGHVFSLITTIFKLNQDIHKINVLTKFHDDWTKNVTSKVKKTPPPGGHVFIPIRTIFELKHWAKNVSSRLFTCFHYIHIKKTAPPPGGHVFQLITTIFKLVRDIYITNAKNVTSRVFTSFFNPTPGGHVFIPIRTFCELNRRIQKTNKTAPPPCGHVF